MRRIPAFIAILVMIPAGLAAGATNAPSTREAAGIQPASTRSSIPISQAQSNEQKIAVTEAGYDDIGGVLDSLGLKYTHIQQADLANYDTIKQFDVIFINCSSDAVKYATSSIQSLETFVSQGGKLYASDWAFIYIAEGFPGYVNFFNYVKGSWDVSTAEIGGEKLTVTADILDPGLQEKLNARTVDIYYDLDSWVPIDSVSDSVQVYLSGDFTTFDGETMTDRPLSVSFPYEKGAVLYTSYHNEPQSVGVTEAEKGLLQYLVLATTTAKGEVTARVEAGASQGDSTGKNNRVTWMVVGIGSFFCLAALVVAGVIVGFFVIRKRRA